MTELPNLSPHQILDLGAFGGYYFRDTDTSDLNPEIFKGIPESKYKTQEYDASINFYGVSCGKGLEFWENKGWIHKDDPAGWFHWYCKFFYGRTHEDDNRQYHRWHGFASSKGRWRNRLYGMIQKAGGLDHLYDKSISPKIRQSLIHWGYWPNEDDYRLYIRTH